MQIKDTYIRIIIKSEKFKRRLPLIAASFDRTDCNQQTSRGRHLPSFSNSAYQSSTSGIIIVTRISCVMRVRYKERAVKITTKCCQYDCRYRNKPNVNTVPYYGLENVIHVMTTPCCTRDNRLAVVVSLFFISRTGSFLDLCTLTHTHSRTCLACENVRKLN